MEKNQSCIIGVDVGGTNTDAVIIREGNVFAWAKSPTSDNVTTGVINAITTCINKAQDKLTDIALTNSICRINIGTTHFINAVIQRRSLAKVAIIRLCRPASTTLPPFSEFPQDLEACINGGIYMVKGGYEFDGRAISEIDTDEIKHCIQDIMDHNIRNIVVSGVFSPVNPQQEKDCASIIHQIFPHCSITMSHAIGHISILERENAAILNESLKPLCYHTINAFRQALSDLNFQCPFYLTQNDGTLISSKQAIQFPVLTFASGSTNSMRGAVYLSGVKDAIVIDIGGTSADVGTIVKGFPREASTRIQVGGVKTNFRLPDVLSIALGGGSIVKQENQNITIGPVSVGFQLLQKALVFGGDTLTTSDIAVAAGLVDMGEKSRVSHLQPELIQKAMNQMKMMLENAIDQVKISVSDVPLILVGGGSVLVNSKDTIQGASTVKLPPYYYVANAVGAALSQISGSIDQVVDLESVERDEAIEQCKSQAISFAVNNGADPSAVEVVEVTELPVTYVAGKALRIKIKAVGDLLLTDTDKLSNAQPTSEDEVATQIPYEIYDEIYKNLSTEKSASMKDSEMESELTMKPPTIDPSTGEWLLNEWDIECISIGAGILGCGGGGSPYIGRLRAKRALKEGKKIRVINAHRLGSITNQSGYAVTVAFMGAPLIELEKLSSGDETKNALLGVETLLKANLIPDRNFNLEEVEEFAIKDEDNIQSLNNLAAVKAAQKNVKSKVEIAALLCAEIGGCNAIEPLILGADLDKPIVDADGMGRAFPELQMFTPTIYGENSCPCCLADCKGNNAISLSCRSAKDLENFMRKHVIQMGCYSGLAFCPMKPSEVLSRCILGSISRSHRLGEAVLTARKNASSPVDAILEKEAGRLLITGKVCDVNRMISGGFITGLIKIQGFTQCEKLDVEIEFQNENLLARSISAGNKAQILACVPDLISIVDSDTGEPITTDNIKYGLRVSVMAIPCASLLRKPEALKVVGPQAFGYDQSVQYQPMPEMIETPRILPLP
ncbi:Hydantoin utilization protein A [Trichoplax sp. H2]|nr:Hydantoin utilization protein A [Trichoplax sp. H2]|eukprot:RDD44862.1 Hydantoin utilization protein A [Trichoplax sp. H2]